MEESISSAPLTAGSERVSDHVRACDRCEKEADLARAFHTGENLPVPNARQLEYVVRQARQTTEEWHRQKRRTILGMPTDRFLAIASGVAATVLVFLFGASLFNSGPVPSPIDASLPVVTRGHRIEAVSPKGPLASAPEYLEWDAAGSGRFRITVSDLTGQIVYQEESTDNRIAVPELRSKLKRGTKYQWVVQAIDENGEGTYASPPAEFHWLLSDQRAPGTEN